MRQKYSRQREMLLEELRTRSDHPTADEIYITLREKIPNISLGTVYRNLSMLSESGQILRIEGDGPDRYDGDISEHYHFRCINCSSLVDIPAETQLFNLNSWAEKFVDGEIQSHSIIFFGKCRKCLENKTDENEKL